MKYYLIQGGVLQAGMIKNSGGLLNQFIYDKLDYFTFSENVPDQEATALIMKSTSKKIDIIPGFGSGKGFIMSQRLLDILGKFNLPPYKKVCRITIAHKKVVYDDYFFVHFLPVPDSSHPVDLGKSIFLNHDASHHTTFPSLKEAADVGYFLREGGEVWLSKTASQYDFFRFNRLDGGYVASEHLVEQLQVAKILGFEYIPAPWIHSDYV